MATYSWYLGGPAVEQSVPWLYSSAVISGASLFVLSYVYQSRKSINVLPTSQRMMLALFDVATYYSVITLVLWGSILPLLRPITSPNFQLYLFDQQSLATSLYAGLAICMIVVISRVALQLLVVHPPIPRRPSPIPVVTVAALPQQAESNKENGKAIEDSLSLIRSEIAMLREQISSFSPARIDAVKNSMPMVVDPPPSNSGWSPVKNPDTFLPVPVAQVSPLPAPYIAPAVLPQEPVAAVQQESEPTTGEVQLPDSARDNPWASVLSRRQVKVVPVQQPTMVVETFPPPAPDPFPASTLPPPEVAATIAIEKRSTRKAKRKSRVSKNTGPVVEIAPEPKESELPAVPVTPISQETQE